MELSTYKAEQIEAIMKLEEDIGTAKSLGVRLFHHNLDGTQVDITAEYEARQQQILASMKRALRFIEEQIAKAGKL
ncbi:hypothetical protein [Rhizobium sp. 60-20]|uniref:hypothetical protein n=1 Tax=Rhizobium sp. 60-20 TaxID=1895819 RepID=UPI000A7C55F8|nr:hypothetical protein [Rhizobium sp. 60-20]